METGRKNTLFVMYFANMVELPINFTRHRFYMMKFPFVEIVLLPVEFGLTSASGK